MFTSMKRSRRGADSLSASLQVAMKNSCPEALAAADFIAPSNVEDGVAQVIEDYLARGLIGGM